MEERVTEGPADTTEGRAGAKPRAVRELTRRVMVGGVPVGGGAPVSVQSMCTTKTLDPAATLSQIGGLAAEGCEIIRVAIPNAGALDGFGEVCAMSPLPVVADIHFDHRLAIEACRRGAAALRINPGNIGSFERVDAVIEEAGSAGIPIRIGVNAGSLDREVDQRRDLSLPQKLVASAEAFVRHFEERGFRDVVLSAKAHSVPTTLATYRELSRRLPHVPLHVGVTEAGTLRQGTVKNCAGVGILLEQGIGDTLRLSLTADPVEEVRVAWDLLSALGMRRLHPELVSCPTCGRCQVDLIGMAERVSERLQGVEAPISVAVMGCVVNGPGEARDADLGVACGRGQGLLFQNGEPIRKVPEGQIVDELFREIEERYGSKA
ncbi:4-hydroxy-3-methylbut-2-en-1-yl diphosphate synthase [Olsenella sp. oral taxon 809 str. F0356]|uniref:flavodoxin-dependent (E)-4-hydroxy-3-methylbut-2-enyl-diphosphate synthase n=1 Tax=Olsenella sp. oral taxon 809 TaxID=661086 RepID=UPI000231F1CE|nr:flavodoxin-dependent (E)-4-hydroxy-3-methylbut-2-enyl-diphosphate synthase [Olsenella sp. oral taxon 809]EHF01788.1 4-hydroxy-3-methylbut-2-en-1-yl diphosphate synthase [Olsenella sp. oral taxon 809 str. F0356]